MGMIACAIVAAFALPSARGQSSNAPAKPAQRPSITADDGSGVVIENNSPLPDTFPRANYSYRFTAHGPGLPVHWRLETGALPPGLKLEDTGELHGSPQRPGEFHFTVSATPSSGERQAVQKAFVLRVVDGIILNWKNPAHVSGSRIEGSVEVSNITPDDMDLTFVVMAVDGNGRATAIGYQRFVLHAGGVAIELPFGETLAHGGYVVHVDVVGEVANINAIYRQRMQTPGALQVTVGP
jgi:hypothetical protein